jgi:hypothetical protein
MPTTPHSAAGAVAAVLIMAVLKDSPEAVGTAPQPCPTRCSPLADIAHLHSGHPRQVGLPPIDASSSNSATTTTSGKSSKQPAASPKGAAESKGLWAKWSGVLTSLDFWLVNLSNLLVYFVPHTSVTS